MKQLARHRFHLEISAFWFGVAFLWSGLITIVVQSRVAEMAPQNKDLVLGLTLALGAIVSTWVCYDIGARSDRARNRWVQRFGRRRPFIVLGTLAAVPALIALPFANNILSLILVLCGIQFAVNFATAPYQALIPDLVPKSEQGGASAWMGMSSLLGTSLGLLAYGTIFPQVGGLMRITFLVIAILLVTMLITIWRVREETVTVVANAPQEEPFDWRQAWREQRDFFWLIGSRFMINLGFYSVTEFLLYYVTDTLRAPDPQATVMKFFLISTVAGLIGNFPAGFLSDRVSKKLVVYVSLAITGVAALVFLLADSIQTATYAAWIFGAGYGAFLAVDWALATNLLPARDEARWMGIWHGAFTVPQVVAPVVGGVTAHLFNRMLGQGAGYRAVLFSVLIYLALGALMIRPIREKIHTG